MAGVGEEQYVLRVLDPAVAEQLRSALREELNLNEALQLNFPANGRQGTLTLNGVQHPVHVLDLPTTVESYKTYDDVNLVKTGDVGQVLVVGQLTPAQQLEIKKAQDAGGPGAPVESVDGLTPPMHNARGRHLRPRIDVPADLVSKVEESILDILDGAAPSGTTFEDFEEEYRVDEATGRGRWQPAPKITQKERDAAREKELAAAKKEEEQEEGGGDGAAGAGGAEGGDAAAGGSGSKRKPSRKAREAGESAGLGRGRGRGRRGRGEAGAADGEGRGRGRGRKKAAAAAAAAAAAGGEAGASAPANGAQAMEVGN